MTIVKGFEITRTRRVLKRRHPVFVLRPANLNPTAAISAHKAEILHFQSGTLSGFFGEDLHVREKAAEAYLQKRKGRISRLKAIVWNNDTIEEGEVT